MNRLSPWLPALAALALAGCYGTRTVTIEGPQPPPTVVTRTDTLVVMQPPRVPTGATPRIDTVIVEGEPRVIEREVVVTRPVEVVRYLTPRPDTTAVFRLAAFRADSTRLNLFGIGQTLTYRLPRPGEVLDAYASGLDTMQATVTGRPERPAPIVIDCPAPPPALILRTLPGYGMLALMLMGAAFVGFVARSILPQ